MVALNARWSCGSATFTTVPSTKTMLEASIVAARIHRSARAAHGAPAAIERITASSHGVRATVLKMIAPLTLLSGQRYAGGLLQIRGILARLPLFHRDDEARLSDRNLDGLAPTNFRNMRAKWLGL